jgi:drug/metabolite transporter (DMT)-like permease
VLAPFALRRALAERRQILAAWRPVLLLGFVGVACFNAFLYSGLRHTTATNALLMQAAIPAVVLAADFLLFRLRPKPVQVAGVLLSMVGVVLIVLRGDLGAIGQARLNSGDLLVLAGVVCWATYTALLKRRPPLHPMSFLLATFAVGAVAMLPLAASEWQEARQIAWTGPALLAVAYVAVLPSVVAYALFNAAVARLGAAAAGQAVNLLPVFGAALAAAMLGEPLRPYHLAGMALVLLGIAVPAVLAGRAPRSA